MRKKGRGKERRREEVVHTHTHTHTHAHARTHARTHTARGGVDLKDSKEAWRPERALGRDVAPPDVEALIALPALHAPLTNALPFRGVLIY
jgi:hypothetical protein